VTSGALNVAARKQLKESKSFELFIVSGVSILLDTATPEKSRFFYGGTRIILGICSFLKGPREKGFDLILARQHSATVITMPG